MKKIDYRRLKFTGEHTQCRECGEVFLAECLYQAHGLCGDCIMQIANEMSVFHSGDEIFGNKRNIKRKAKA